MKKALEQVLIDGSVGAIEANALCTIALPIGFYAFLSLIDKKYFASIFDKNSFVRFNGNKYFVKEV